MQSLSASTRKRCFDDSPSARSNDTQSKYSVLIRKPTAKKHKTWENDGELAVSGTRWRVTDDSGLEIENIQRKGMPAIDEVYRVGSKEIQVIECLSNIFEDDRKCPGTNFPGFEPFLMSTAKQGPPPTKQGLKDVPRATVVREKENTFKLIPPFLTCLFDYQKEGVKFLYERVCDLDKSGNNGVILADEMGLGKTVQVICLIWNLLNQTGSSKDRVQKALIVCPASLIENWQREFRKWLGSARINVLAVNSKSDVSLFLSSKNFDVMIMGYERLKHIRDHPQLDSIHLFVCDEGHRLKNNETIASKILESLCTVKKVIITGTPFQNDLQELFTIANFVNPGCLGEERYFKKHFEMPINRGRAFGCLKRDKDRANQRALELYEVLKTFMLRRTISSVQYSLSGKTEYVVFCKSLPAQAKAYSDAIRSANTRFYDAGFQLEAITNLRQIASSGVCESNHVEEILASSVKFTVLQSMLQSLYHEGKKVVVVSHFTSVLDKIEVILERLQHKFCRLDGSTKVSARQLIVDDFNKNSFSESFCLLISAKAGGLGLNIPGASRMILFDLDWNPSTDQQSISRIYRGGQSEHCIVWRLLTAGTIDEKVFQRQIMKLGLSELMIDGISDSSLTFTDTELRDLYTFNKESASMTHELLECNCAGDGTNSTISLKEDVENGGEHPLGFIPASQISESMVRLHIQKLSLTSEAYIYQAKIGRISALC